MSYLIYFIILFVLLYIFHSDEEGHFPRALAVAAALTGVAYMIHSFGIIGKILALIASLFIVMKIMKYNFVSAFLFLLVAGVIEIILEAAIFRLT